jgi:hypothetical protein
MSLAATAPRGIDLRAIADAVAPRPVRFDPLGLVSGFKAYQIYTALAAKTDAELSQIGLVRSDLPRVAMTAINEPRES